MDQHNLPSPSNVLKMDDIFRHVLSYLTVLDIRRAARTCQQWNNVIEKGNYQHKLMVVTVSGSNELALISTSGQIVQELTAAPVVRQRRKSRKRKLSTTATTRTRPTECEWPTCMETGPEGQLFVSQYKISGLLEFSRSLEGYTYRRKHLAHGMVESPEGVVCAHNSLYVVSLDRASVTRISMDPKKHIKDIAKRENYLEGKWILSGMCISPDQRSLFIAGYLFDEGDFSYRLPTQQDTGRILRLDLEADGSFRKGPNGFTRGYYIDMPPPQTVDVAEEGRTMVHIQPPMALNRPSNPAFCRHGVLHVASFVIERRGYKRRIQKIIPHGFPWRGETTFDQCPMHLGWLEQEKEESDEQRTIYSTPHPWGISFSKTSDEVYVTTCYCDGLVSLYGGIYKMETCGCESSVFKGQSQPPTTNPDSVLDEAALHATLDNYGAPREISCGKATGIAGQRLFDQPNFVHSLE